MMNSMSMRRALISLESSWLEPGQLNVSKAKQMAAMMPRECLQKLHVFHQGEMQTKQAANRIV